MTKSTTTQTAPAGQNNVICWHRENRRKCWECAANYVRAKRILRASGKLLVTRLQFSPVRHEQAPVGWDIIEGGAL